MAEVEHNEVSLHSVLPTKALLSPGQEAGHNARFVVNDQTNTWSESSPVESQDTSMTPPSNGEERAAVPSSSLEVTTAIVTRHDSVEVERLHPPILAEPHTISSTAPSIGEGIITRPEAGDVQPDEWPALHKDPSKPIRDFPDNARSKDMILSPSLSSNVANVAWESGKLSDTNDVSADAGAPASAEPESAPNQSAANQSTAKADVDWSSDSAWPLISNEEAEEGNLLAHGSGCDERDSAIPTSAP